MINPFEGISELQKSRLFKILETHTYSYNSNEEILSTFVSKNVVCILLQGHAQIINISDNGEENLIEELFENSVFGSSISDINRNDNQIRAIENSKILVIDYNKLINSKNTCYTYYNLFVVNILNIITTKLKENNNRIGILTQKSIRNKLLTFFENEYKRTHSRFIYLPNNFKDLADYLSINRSAMFRELKSLKEENFIKVDGKRITLLYTPNI